MACPPWPRAPRGCRRTGAILADAYAPVRAGTCERPDSVSLPWVLATADSLGLNHAQFQRDLTSPATCGDQGAGKTGQPTGYRWRPGILHHRQHRENLPFCQLPGHAAMVCRTRP